MLGDQLSPGQISGRISVDGTRGYGMTTMSGQLAIRDSDLNRSAALLLFTPVQIPSMLVVYPCSTVYCKLQLIGSTAMARKSLPRPKVKTAIIQVRVEPNLKAAAEKAAGLDHRSLTNWIEVLIIGRCKELEVEPSTTVSSCD
jgi:hypothetical protein